MFFSGLFVEKAAAGRLSVFLCYPCMLICLHCTSVADFRSVQTSIQLAHKQVKTEERFSHICY